MFRKNKFYRHIRFFINTFIDKELILDASSLSFYTILTVIPLLLIIFTLLTTLESFWDYYEEIKSFIFSNLMPVNSQLIMQYVDVFLENSAQIGFIGFILIIVASFMFYESFEYIANKIFHAKNRTFLHSTKTYLTLLLVNTFVLALSFYISTKVVLIIESNHITSGLNIVPLITFILIWGLSFIIFQITINTKVSYKASLISTFILTLIFSISKYTFIYYVIYNKSYTTIYGSFASLMFLFLWIYVSWIIFIYGLKLCYMINRVYKKRDAKKK